MSEKRHIETYSIWTHINALVSAAWILLSGERVRKIWQKAARLVREAEGQLRLALAEMAGSMELPLLRPRALVAPKTETKSAERVPSRVRGFSILPPAPRFAGLALSEPDIPFLPKKPVDHAARLIARMDQIDEISDAPGPYAQRLARLLARRCRTSIQLRYAGAGLTPPEEALALTTPPDPPPGIDSS